MTRTLRFCQGFIYLPVNEPEVSGHCRYGRAFRKRHDAYLAEALTHRPEKYVVHVNNIILINSFCLKPISKVLCRNRTGRVLRHSWVQL